MLLHHKTSVLIIAQLFCVLVMSAQTVDISGIVNLYSSVTAVLPCPNIVRIENPERFAVGDTVLLIQMKGATVDTTAGSTFGMVTAMNRAGRFERNVVDSIGGNAIRLRFRMLSALTGPPYEGGQGVQLIRIPSYSNARVIAPLTCPPWDGKTGGVLMITIRNTLILDADITADGKGFDQEDGIARTDQVVAAGGLATAGRGGAWFTSSNSGRYAGSGGAHAGCGGRATGYSPQPVRYQAGYNWIFMGGGGGSAGDSATKGGRGGGIAIIDVPEIIGNNVAIISARGLSGAHGGLSAPKTSGGGGGAGGAVLVTALSLVNIPTLSADGGSGGNRSTDPERPGSGGGGGVILFGTVNDLNLNTISYAGGSAPAGGEAGCPGDNFYNNLINEAKQLFRSRLFSVVDDTTICAGTEATLIATIDGTIAWSDGTTTLCSNCDTLRIAPQATTTYLAVMTYTDGCIDTSRVVVTVRPLPVLTMTDPLPFCDSIVVTAPAGFARYVWNTGDTTATIVVRTARTLTLTVYDDLGCYASVSITTRFRGDTLLVFETLPSDGSPFFIDSIFPGEKSCLSVPVRNRSDADLVILSARMAHGVEISVPLAQFPVTTSPSPSSTPSTIINVCASASIPGIYTDTMFLLSACGEIACPLTTTVLETKNYSRCNVRVTSDGEIEVLAADARPVVADLMGRELTSLEIEEIGKGAYVVRGLRSGAYLLRVGTTSQLLLR